jgi:hypothetical protein
VVLFPSGSGHAQFRRRGVSPFQPLGTRLRARDIAVIDLSEAFAARFGDASLCPYLTRPEPCVGHYNPAGNRIVAELLAPRVSALLAGRQ